MRRSRVPLLAGAVLAFLLGLARGAGGVVLLLRGAAADPGIHATGTAVRVVAMGLVGLGLLLMGAAAGILRRRRGAYRLAFLGLAMFVADGVINGTVLYGRPGDAGTVVNVVAASIIGSLLLAGRKARRRAE